MPCRILVKDENITTQIDLAMLAVDRTLSAGEILHFQYHRIEHPKTLPLKLSRDLFI